MPVCMVLNDSCRGHPPHGEHQVEFISMGEIAELLRSHGIAQSSQDEEHVYYRMTDDAAVLHRQLSTPDSQIEPLEGAEMVEVANDRMAEVTDAILHKLHHNQIILIPVEMARISMQSRSALRKMRNGRRLMQPPPSS